MARSVPSRVRVCPVRHRRDHGQRPTGWPGVVADPSVTVDTPFSGHSGHTTFARPPGAPATSQDTLGHPGHTLSRSREHEGHPGHTLSRYDLAGRPQGTHWTHPFEVRPWTHWTHHFGVRPLRTPWTHPFEVPRARPRRSAEVSVQYAPRRDHGQRPTDWPGVVTVPSLTWTRTGVCPRRPCT